MLPVCLCGVLTDISTPTFTIPQDLSESPSSPSYLILQQLTVCRYHTALQPAGSRINPKLSGRLNHLFGSCWFRWNGVVQMLNFQWSTVLILDWCVWTKKKKDLFFTTIWHSVLCSLRRLCHTSPLWMVYTAKPGCCALNNSVLKRETLKDISHDNNEIANNCIMHNTFFFLLLLLTLQYDIFHVWTICVLAHTLCNSHPSSGLLQADVAHSTFQQFSR